MFHIGKNDETEELYKRIKIVRGELNTPLGDDTSSSEMILIKSQQLDKLIEDYQKLIQ